MPGGLAQSRRDVRRRGGAAGIVVAVSLWVAGLVLRVVLGGTLGGVASFIFLVMALPVMPLLGMPASGGTIRFVVSLAVSGTLWWFVGQVVAGRVTRRPVAGWREWLREFVVVSMGIWAGAAGGLVLAALALGAL